MTIQDVIAELEEISSLAVSEGARYGYFATLYLGMTRSVRDALGKGLYDNDARMEHLCVVFAQRYLDAFATWRAGKPPTKSWAIAFSHGQRDEITTIQHLLLGVNAHINLDLGIATQNVALGSDIDQLKPDFDRINDTISTLFNVVKGRLRSISWPIRYLDDMGGSFDDRIATFSIRIARDEAWHFAKRLHTWPAFDHAKLVAERDMSISLFAQRIIDPGFTANLILRPVKWAEPRDVRKILAALR
ncbi:MAG: hypothetical protein IPH85_00740 [Ignavibacteria bacterium]|nr:hypothetical protein [Ignavibacteria bacterium]MBP6509305.1 hypothetical protein [Candidatus Kapabacteria bacterium]MBK6419808.1 hypothetical protein [Ignavibacteria bacterium]MBK6759561.1 hypothetical protein [Ignavibacteria bacterium]MBK7184451.1 hypothetical protein [Ignavibacteria bacterium]